MSSGVEIGFVTRIPAQHPGGKFRFHRDPTCTYVADSPTLTEVEVVDGVLALPPGQRLAGRKIKATPAKCCEPPAPPDPAGRAACRGFPKGWWLSPQPSTTQRAKEICASCPVRAGCEAAAPDDDDAIWGGLTRSEREARTA